MSQRLGSSLRRKVSETETQLLALHEAKLAAISGNTTIRHTLFHIYHSFFFNIYLIYPDQPPLASRNCAINDVGAH